MQNFRADSLSGPRLSLSGNIPFTCRKAPCIHEWTGFTIEPPDANEDDTFRVIPVVPRSDAREREITVTP